VAVSLPMSFGVESINLAAAVAACCFERSRQSQPSAAD
jgi:tRNA(Leu) C34 or U34 (ribose-2'-O)-methylase TrmL